MNKPFSPSADRNKEPILNALRHELAAGQTVLEIGSGTGQHACHFADALPQIIWQPTELEKNLPAINTWRKEYELVNVLEPLALDVDVNPWPATDADACYTCNTFHIVSMKSVMAIFEGSKAAMNSSGKLCVYGPFAIDGQHSSSGNASFDQQLRASNPESGIRDIKKLDDLAQQLGFNTCRTTAMPANNLFVVWETSSL